MMRVLTPLFAGWIAVSGCDCGDGEGPLVDGAAGDASRTDGGGRDGGVPPTDAPTDGATGVDGGPRTDAGPSIWYEVGESAFGAHRTRIIGSAFGGGISGRWLESEEPDLAVDATGRIVVAWSEGWSVQPDWEVHAMGWDGTSWSALGGRAASDNDGASRESSVDVADDGTAVVAWSDDTSGNLEIYVRHWTGTAWMELGGSASGGGISATAGESHTPCVRLDGAAPVVAWDEAGAIHVRRWNGSAWAALGSSATGSGLGGGWLPELELTAAGDPVVAWGAGGVRVLRWNGSAWVGLDGGAAPSIVGSATDTFSMDVDGDGDPVVAWQDDASGNYEIYVRRWNGSAWLELAGSGTGGGVSSSATGLSVQPSVAIDGKDRVVVAWSEDQTGGWNAEIFLRRFDGATWQEIGGSATGGGVSMTGGAVTGTTAWSYDPELVVDDAGDPIVAWQEWTSGNAEIYLRKLDGTSWVSLGDTARATGSVSRTPGRSIAPSVALDAELDPVVAWLDVMGGHIIHVTRYDGTDWTGARYPAIDVGVPINFGWDRVAPSLVLDDREEPIVAWADNMERTFVDRWNGTAWERLGGGTVGTGSWHPALALLDSDPIVALCPYVAPQRQVHVLRYTGGTWEPLDGVGGDVSGTAADAHEPVLAVTSDDRVVLAIQEGNLQRGEIRVLVWDGTSWGGLGGSDAATGITDGSARAGPPALAIGADDRPVVAWFQEVARFAYALRALHWDGSAWVPYEDVVVADGFASIFTGSRAPALALDTNGYPVVGWIDDRTGPNEIYVLRWDGARWVNDPGAADGGGISNSTASSRHPFLASRPGRVCLAWDEFGRDSVEILLRCADL